LDKSKIKNKRHYYFGISDNIFYITGPIGGVLIILLIFVLIFEKKFNKLVSDFGLYEAL
jgi:hypothetical protein